MSKESINYLTSALLTIVIVAALVTFFILELSFGAAACIVALAAFARIGIYSLLDD